MSESLSSRARLWRWAGPEESGAWFFVSFVGDQAEALSATAMMRKLEGLRRGFGSLRVTATIGDTSWRTSVFPSKSGEWLLPVKAAVRKGEGLEEGDEVAVRIAL